MLDSETLVHLSKLSWALFPEKNWGARLWFSPKFRKNWGGLGPPGPLGDYIPELDMRDSENFEALHSLMPYVPIKLSRNKHVQEYVSNYIRCINFKCL